MFRPIRSLLFATDLSDKCIPALESSIFLASQHGAAIVLLHVIDKEVPMQFEDHFRSVVGEERWKSLKEELEQEARNTLIGKMTSSKIMKKIVQQHRENLGVEDAALNLDWREVVRKNKNIDRGIVAEAEEQGCDLIILGSGPGFLGGNSVGNTVKGVLRKSKIPVMVVPAQSVDEPQ